MDSIRGYHSTGVISVSGKGNKRSILKDAVDGAHFTQTKEWANFRGHNKDSKILIGHNRWATQGEVNKQNSHPFSFGNISGVHNGTLHYQSNLPDYTRFEVDSENIYWSFHKKGVEWTLERLDGAFALVWYDSSKRTLNFARNDERPLWIAELTDGTIAWASEEGMLTWLIERSKRLPNIKNIASLKEGVWKSINIDGTVTDKKVNMEVSWTKYQQDCIGYGQSYNQPFGNENKNIVKASIKEQDNASLSNRGIPWEVGQRVRVTMSGFKAYPGDSGVGSIHCYNEQSEMCDDVTTVITSRRESEFEEGKEVSAVVSYVYPMTGGGIKVTFCDPKPIVLAVMKETELVCGTVLTDEEFERDFDHTCYTCGMDISYSTLHDCAKITDSHLSCPSCVEDMRERI